VTWRGLEGPENVWQQAWWAMAHALEELVGSKHSCGVYGTAGRTAGRVGVQHQGHCRCDGPLHMGEHFLRVWEMGSWKGQRKLRLVVRRHRMMGQGKELEGYSRSRAGSIM